MATALAESEHEADQDYRRYTLDLLHHAVTGMNLDNFIVRPRRETVERYQQRERWNTLDTLAVGELNNHIGPLPTEAEPINPGEANNEMAMRFDHLALRLQLALLEEGIIPEGLRLQVIELAHQLEAKASIPNVKQQLHFIQQVQTDEWWQDITIPMLEELRSNLRLLIQFIDPKKREVVYTTFQDELGEMTDRNVVGIMGGGSGLTQYRKKVEAYIKSHEDHLTIQRIKRNRPVTAKDLEQLDEMLFQASSMESREDYDKTIHPEKPLGVFIRELIGLDRHAAKEAFAEFLNVTTMNATQIQFINTLIDYFTQNGVMEPQHLTQPPFSDIHDDSVFGLFSAEQVQAITGKIRWINQNADAVTEEVQIDLAAEQRPPY